MAEKDPFASDYIRSGLSLLPVIRGGQKTPAFPLLPQELDETTAKYNSVWTPLQNAPADRGRGRGPSRARSSGTNPSCHAGDCACSRKSFFSRALQLCFAAEGEEVVTDDVVLAVMLMEAAVAGAIDQVVLSDDVRTALVEVDTPAPVAVAGDVVENVRANHRAGLDAQRVDATQVT